MKIGNLVGATLISALAVSFVVMLSVGQAYFQDQDNPPPPEEEKAQEPPPPEPEPQEPAAQEPEAQAPEAQEAGEEPSAVAIPVKGKPDPSVVPNFSKAKPLAVNVATDIEFRENEAAWFKVTVDASEPVVLRVGGLNTWGAGVKVYDASGAKFSPGPFRDDRRSGWHGKVTPGTYYVRLQTLPPEEQAGDFSAVKMSAEERVARAKAKKPTASDLGTQAAMLVMVDPSGPGETPRRAAQLGLDYLEIDSPAWQNRFACNGCHLQSQTLMGMALAKKNGYKVQERAALALGEFIADQFGENPSERGDHNIFAVLALRYYVSGFTPSRKDLLVSVVKGIVANPPENFVFDSGDRMPIEGGTITGTAMAVGVMAEALQFANPQGRTQLKPAHDRAYADLKSASAKTVQDHVMKIIASVDAGEKGDKLSNKLAALLALQQRDGGFGEKEGGGESNAYGTGQALYGLKLAGYSTEAPPFKAGVKWLVNHQLWSGTWPLLATECQSDIAHTMWAVIGLAGSLEASLPVRVTAVARDASGNYISDLKKEDFSVSEDGVTQTIIQFRRDVGDRSIVLIIDTSGSIKAELPGVVQAATTFLGLLGASDRVALEQFSSRVKPPGAFTTDRASVAAELKQLKAAGGTALYDSVGVALTHLKDSPEPRAIVLLTDGKDEDASGKRAGSKATLSATLARLKEEGTPLFALGLGSGVEKEILTRLAGASGGRAFFAPTAKDLDAVYRELAGALRAQYVLVYNSTKASADNKWRAIEVKVARPGVKVQATPGYTASRDLLQ